MRVVRGDGARRGRAMDGGQRSSPTERSGRDAQKYDSCPNGERHMSIRAERRTSAKCAATVCFVLAVRRNLSATIRGASMSRLGCAERRPMELCVHQLKYNHKASRGWWQQGGEGGNERQARREDAHSAGRSECSDADALAQRPGRLCLPGSATRLSTSLLSEGARPNHIANAWTKSIPGICLILRLAYPCRSTSRSSKPRWPPRASLRP